MTTIVRVRHEYKTQNGVDVVISKAPVEQETPFPLRRIVAAAHRAMIAYGWTRRRAIKFALGHYKSGTLSDSTSYRPRYQPRPDMPGEVQEQLTHRRRSMAR